MTMTAALAAPNKRLVAIMLTLFALCALLLTAPAKARAFDLDGTLHTCSKYKLPDQAEERLACLNDCIDSLRSFIASLKGTYGPATTACGLRCIDTFKTKINACVDQARQGSSEAQVDACINGVTDEAEACSGGCGYPDDDL